jgi:hypothetical protein
MVTTVGIALMLIIPVTAELLRIPDSEQLLDIGGVEREKKQ